MGFGERLRAAIKYFFELKDYERVDGSVGVSMKESPDEYGNFRYEIAVELSPLLIDTMRRAVPGTELIVYGAPPKVADTEVSIH